MSEKTKAPNYTEEMVDRLHAVYQPDAPENVREQQIGQLADELNRTVKSVRAKLVREKLYVKKEYKAKTGDAPERKAAIVADIATALGVDSDIVGSLEKATKVALNKIRAALTS